MGNGLLSINFATTLDIQNTPDIIGATAGNIQKDDNTASPLTISKYVLYNRTLDVTSNFGWNDPSYLSYEGGFITCGDKVNSKYGDFILTRNLTIQNTSLFKTGVDVSDERGLPNNRFTNLKVLTQNEFYSTTFDNDIIRVQDFRTLTKFKGMVVMWTGTYETLVRELPLWRLCAPPDSDINGTTINDVFVPNLQSKFVLGGTYTSSGTFQAKDNLNRNFGTPTSIDGNNSGGLNNVKLTADQLPDHRHDNRVILSGSTSSINGTNLPDNTTTAATFYNGGGNLSVTELGYHSSATPATAEANRGSTFTTINGVTRNAFNKATITLTPTRSRITRTSHEERGGKPGYANFDCDVHENRPRFYALAYIVYVDTPR